MIDTDLPNQSTQEAVFQSKNFKSPIPSVPPIKKTFTTHHFTQTQNTPLQDDDFKQLLCGTTPTYILHKKSNFCELLLKDEVYSHSLKTLLAEFLKDRGIKCSFMEYPQYRCFRFPLNEKAFQFLKNPAFKGSFIYKKTDPARAFAASLIDKGEIKLFQSSQRGEMLIPPVYLRYENDIINIFQQNKIPCKKIFDYRTKLNYISFKNSQQVKKFLKNFPHVKITVVARDYLKFPGSDQRDA